MPHLGKTLSTPYANSMSAGAYLGLAGSGVFCNVPFSINAFSYEPMGAGYDCPVEALPHNWEAWNPKWFSPICRPWFQNQRDHAWHNTLSDLYTFANSDFFGLTPCAPILKQRDEDNANDTDFYGAICMDMNPSGPLSDYFAFKESDKATYLLFNNDDAFDTITNVEESQFKSFIESVVGSRLSESEKFDRAKVTELDAWAKRARLYDNKHVTWGLVKFELSNESDEDGKDMSFLYTVSNVIQDYRKFELNNDYENTKYESDSVLERFAVVGQKLMKLAFFVDATRIQQKISQLDNTLVKEVFYQVLMVIFLANTGFVILGILRARRIAMKMTSQIIHLYETLYQIAENKKQNNDFKLNYKPSCEEINELHLTFNRVATIIKVASSGISQQVTEE